ASPRLFPIPPVEIVSLAQQLLADAVRQAHGAVHSHRIHGQGDTQTTVRVQAQLRCEPGPAALMIEERATADAADFPAKAHTHARYDAGAARGNESLHSACGVGAEDR